MIFKKNEELRFGSNMEILDSIPNGNWLLMYDEVLNEYYLQSQSSFTLPKKIYGDEESVVDRYLNTFNSKKGNQGCFFSGQKGGGKTLISKLLCLKSELPVILITQPFVGEVFQNFLSKIEENCVVFVDEFEKVYHSDELQQEFLPILDGVFQGKKLFIFTSNSAEINTYLKSRPGRIRYHKVYNGVSQEILDEIVEDLLEDKKFKTDIQNIADILTNVSIDVLINLIQEVNMYKESPKDAIKYLNIQVENSKFDVLLFVDGKKYTSKVYYHPMLRKKLWVSYIDDDGRYRDVTIDTEMCLINTLGTEFTFKDKNSPTKMIFTPTKEFDFNF